MLPLFEIVISEGLPCYQLEIDGMIIRRQDRWQIELLAEQFRAGDLPPNWFDRPLGSRAIFFDDSPEPDPGV